MELSRSLLRSFARTINDDSRNKKVTNSMSGTVVMSGDRKFVKIDGSEALTPVFETVDIQEGDRVYVSIENHQASVIGNYSYPPSARVANQANAMAADGILKVDALTAISITTQNLTAHSATITNLVAQNINAGYAKITELDALKGNIKTLSGDVLNYKNATFEQLNAANGRIDNLSGDVLNYKNATFEQLEAAEGKITKLEGDVVSYKNATFEELEATKGQIDELNGNFISYKEAVFEQLEAAEGKITNLEGDYLEYKQAVLNELQAQDAIITNLSGDFASYKEVMAGELLAAKGWMLEGSIGNAQISSLNATKITSGILDTSLITVKGSDGKLQIVDNTIQISDANRVRVQIGKDGSNDYSMSVWDQNGLLIWDALGATENTIQRKIIRDKMVAEDAAIQALKIDFQSFETALTNQGVTISGTVVQVGNKTLNVELSEQKQYIDDSIDNIEIGGRNIATGTNQGTVGWSWSMQVGGAIKESVVEDGINCCKLTKDDTEQSGWSFIFYKNIGRSKYKPNTVYTVSVEVKSNLVDVITFNGLTCTNDTGKMLIDNFVRNKNISSTWTKVSWVVTTRDVLPEATDQGVYFTVSSTNSLPGMWYMFRNLKIEEGNKATAWTPAPEDTQTQIDEHTETLSDHSTKISANEKAINLRVTSQEYESYKSTVNGELASHNSRLNTAESGIDILQDKISLKVEQTDITNAIDNLEIGGRNYIHYGKGDVKKGFFKNLNVSPDGYGYITLTSQNQYKSIDLSNGFLMKCRDYVVGSKVTISYDFMYTEWNFPEGTNHAELWLGQRYTSQNISGGDTTGRWRAVTQHGLPVVGKDGCELNKWIHVEKTITIPEQAAEGIGDYDCIQFYNSNPDVAASISFRIKNVKLEYGNKATDWTPAPEDVDSAISNVDAKFANYSTTTQMQTAIDVSRNDILSSVSETYSTKTEYSTLLGQVSTLETWKYEASQLITKDGIISTVGNYYATIDDVHVGGRNLLYNSGEFKDLTHWTNNATGANIHLVTEDDKSIIRANASIAQDYVYRLKWGTEYVYHAYVKFTTGSSASTSFPLHCWISKSNYANSITSGLDALNMTVYVDDVEKTDIPADEWCHIVIKFKTIDKPDDYRYILFRPFLYGGPVDNGPYWVRWIKLEEGKVATDWTPAPEDTATRITAAEAVIKQHAESIELRVEKAGIISAINQTSESIKIAASKINLDGYVTMTDLSTKGKTTIVGDNITSGTITGITFKGVTGDFTGKITATSGSIGGWTFDATRMYIGSRAMGSGGVGIVLTNEDNKPYIHVQDSNNAVTFEISRTGYMIANAGTIGCWTLSTNRMHDSNNNAGVNKYGQGMAFWAGGSDVTGNTARFRVDHNGHMTLIDGGNSQNLLAHVEVKSDNSTNPSCRTGLWSGGVSVVNSSGYETGLFDGGLMVQKDAVHNYTHIEGGSIRTHLVYMGEDWWEGTERQIIFKINSGTYTHNSYIYGGNSNSDFAIGVWDGKNSVSVWRYNDVYKTLEVNSTFILKNGFEIYGTYPNIDFHYNNNGSSDYTSRIIEMTSGVLQVNGVKFSSSNITAARGSFYGTYTSTLGNRYGSQGLEIRENGLVTNTQSDIGYAPAIGFHWAGRIAASLVFHNDGGFRFMNQAYTDFVPVFVSTLYLGGAPYGQIYCGTSYQLYINPRGSGAVYIGYDNRCIIPPSGGAAIRGNGDGTYDCGHTSYLWGTVYAKNGVKTTSDEREKDIMSLDLSELSDCFMSLEPIAFCWAYGNDRKIHLGVGAQTTERKMIEAGYDPSQFDMIQHDDLEERSVSGLTERYGINYQDLNILTMMQTQKTTREFKTFLKGFKEWKDTVDVDLSLFKDEQDELKKEVQNLKIELALANQKIAELSAKTA